MDRTVVNRTAFVAKVVVVISYRHDPAARPLLTSIFVAPSLVLNP
jgi:hypothetical protein